MSPVEWLEQDYDVALQLTRVAHPMLPELDHLYCADSWNLFVSPNAMRGSGGGGMFDIKRDDMEYWELYHRNVNEGVPGVREGEGSHP